MKKILALLFVLLAVTVIGIACGGSSTPLAPSGPVQAVGAPTPMGTLVNTPTETPVFANYGSVSTLQGQLGVTGYTNGSAVTLFAKAPPTNTPTVTSTGTSVPVAGGHDSGSSLSTDPTIVMTPARFNGPCGVAVDREGNVYVMDTGNYVVRKIINDGPVTTIAGQGGVPGMTNGGVTAATFRGAYGVAVDSIGDVYVADTMNNVIRRISTFGKVTTFAGSGVTGATNATGMEATFNKPNGVAVDHDGNLYVADTFNHMIRKINREGVVKTLAGSGIIGSVNARGVSASFNFPTGVAVDDSGNVYVADSENELIRKVDSDGKVTTVAGKLGVRGATDGPVSISLFNYPVAVAVDQKGSVFVADKANHLIRKISKDGIVSTLAGQAGAPGATNGTGPDASFKSPSGIAVNIWGSVIVGDTGNQLIRKIQ